MADPASLARDRIRIGLTAVVVAADEATPYVLVTGGADGLASLPFGPFDPVGDPTLELSLRRWVSEQTGFDIGYVEQLYTFGDRGRDAPLPAAGQGGMRSISVGYLALTPERSDLQREDARWREWYRHFPWEDWRGGRPACIGGAIAPALWQWASNDPAKQEARRMRIRLSFALEGAPWNEERALDRYELLYEAGLTAEAAQDKARQHGLCPTEAVAQPEAFGAPMASDHRRILATAIARLRAKIKYRPVIFELTPDLFTLSQLQRVVESVSGLELHKQNFRRLLDRTGLVEGLGRFEARTGGRPAELFRFRRESLLERPAGGVNVPAPRG
jgi:hypothetical protein